MLLAGSSMNKVRAALIYRKSLPEMPKAQLRPPGRAPRQLDRDCRAGATGHPTSQGSMGSRAGRAGTQEPWEIGTGPTWALYFPVCRVDSVIVKKGCHFSFKHRSVLEQKCNFVCTVFSANRREFKSSSGLWLGILATPPGLLRPVPCLEERNHGFML